jgi:hypothetical protein
MRAAAKVMCAAGGLNCARRRINQRSSRSMESDMGETRFEPANDPAAWTSEQVGGKEGLVRRLDAVELAAIDRFLAAHSDDAPTDITRADMRDPVLLNLAADVNEAIMHGRGAVVLSGFDMSRHSLTDYERIYWAIGTQLGTPVVQSYRQDLIGYVQKEENNPTGRGYLMDVELRPHTDFHEVMSLSSVRTAPEGGESGVVSSLGVHDIILKERPDLLPALYEGFYHASGAETVSAEKVPVFARVDGKLSCYFHSLFIHKAAKILKQELPPLLKEAMEYMSQITLRPDVRAFFVLEPGEMLFWHNFTALHSRETFHDAPGQKRLLLRLWIHPDHGRPMPDVFRERALTMDVEHRAGKASINYAAEPA